MAENVAIGIQDFSDLIKKNYFYIDKTDFIREWWESGDSVTLITRPRRFGKTLNMSMMEQFFSIKYANSGNIFEGLSIWEHEDYHTLQGTYPVISLSFANVKETNYPDTRKKICMLISELYTNHSFLLKSGILEESDVEFFRRISVDMDDVDATMAIHYLCKFLFLYYGNFGTVSVLQCLPSGVLHRFSFGGNRSPATSRLLLRQPVRSSRFAY